MVQLFGLIIKLEQMIATLLPSALKLLVLNVEQFIIFIDTRSS